MRRRRRGGSRSPRSILRVQRPRAGWCDLATRWWRRRARWATRCGRSLLLKASPPRSARASHSVTPCAEMAPRWRRDAARCREMRSAIAGHPHTPATHTLDTHTPWTHSPASPQSAARRHWPQRISKSATAPQPRPMRRSVYVSDAPKRSARGRRSCGRPAAASGMPSHRRRSVHIARRRALLLLSLLLWGMRSERTARRRALLLLL